MFMLWRHSNSSEFRKLGSIQPKLELCCPGAEQVWPAFRHHPLWDTWRRYFRLRVITPPLPYLESGKPYLFAHFPHATFPMGSWLSMPLCDTPETGTIPGLHISSLLQDWSLGKSIKALTMEQSGPLFAFYLLAPFSVPGMTLESRKVHLACRRA